jgi:hypothetical protein
LLARRRAAGSRRVTTPQSTCLHSTSGLCSTKESVAGPPMLPPAVARCSHGLFPDSSSPSKLGDGETTSWSRLVGSPRRSHQLVLPFPGRFGLDMTAPVSFSTGRQIASLRSTFRAGTHGWGRLWQASG